MAQPKTSPNPNPTAPKRGNRGNSGKRNLRIALVVGETSGDRLGAGLIRALKAARPGCTFLGIGGPKMARAGCKILFDMERISVIGLDGLFAKLPDIYRIKRTLIKRFTANPADRPDIFIGIDAPDFNIALAGELKRQHITCLHYVSPTVWAWRGYRIHRIRRNIHHMLTLFPFEADYYRRQKVPVTCVGHPLADEIQAPRTQQAATQIRTHARKKLRLTDSKPNPDPLIAILPGSRRGEIRRLSGLFLQAAHLILKRYPRARFILPFATPACAEEFTNLHGKPSAINLPLKTIHGNARAALEACDIAILASGTVALEAALLQRPHIVSYKLAPLTYWLVQRLRHVDHYSMPNLLLPKPMVTELMQNRATPENIAHEVAALWQDPRRRADLQRRFAKIHAQLKLDADRSAARAVLKLLAHPPAHSTKQTQ